MTDLERFGKHVGSQDDVEFRIWLRETGWEKLMVPRFSWQSLDPYYRFGYVKTMSTASDASLHLFTGQ